MRFLRTLVIVLLIAGFFIYTQDRTQADAKAQSLLNDLQTYVETAKSQPEIAELLNILKDGLDSLTEKMNDLSTELKDQPPLEKIESPSLKTPEEQTFSIHNIEIGDSRDDVEKQAGPAQRSSHNEYGVKWYTYHKNYQNFFMAAYDQQGKIAGLYTNQDLISSKAGIKLNDSKESVSKQLGEPVKGIQKGFVLYQVQNNGEYEIFELDNNYVTVFYDKHSNNTVTALQIIRKDLEQKKNNFFAAGSEELKNGFEYQLFDLTNAARVKNGLSFLSWDDHVKLTARGHSADMAKNQYFSHDSLDGLSPFDRMEQDHITYKAAGENIAAGQVSSIFAHEGLMNSLGHRENILNKAYNAMGVGVAFDSESKPFYTENFIGK